MFNFTEKAAIKIDDLLLFKQDEINAYIKKNQMLFQDLVLDFSPSKQTAYGYNPMGHAVKIAYDNGLVKKIVIRTDPNVTNQVKMVIAYDGSNFHGFQYQSNQRSVQGAFSSIVNPMIGKEDLVQGASRTDAYVHAYGQVIHFENTIQMDEDKWKDILNHQLPKDILVKEVSIEHPLFHSRYDVYQKQYIYKIHLGDYDPFLANYVHFDKNLDLSLMRQALKDLEGTHDFTSFSKSQVDDPIRTIYHTDIIQEGDRLTMVIRGNGFLRYMVRIIVEYLLKIGKNQVSVSMKEVLESRSRKYTQGLASPHALYLEKIIY
jgi:tRNA pseudouridine38-40 synthase